MDRVMTKEEAEAKAKECEKLNGRPFSVVQVQYGNGETGWDVTPSEHVKKSETK